jgi:hypothetical protein
MNELLITGDEKEVKRFHDAITQGELQDHEQFRILDNLLPTPEELQNTPSGSFFSPEQKIVDAKNESNIAKYGYKDWYDWNCANYGSKWSDYEGIIGTYEKGVLDVVFVSAWSPITQGIVSVSKEFPTLNFIHTYSEGGMAFCGGSAIRNGQEEHSIEPEYPSMTLEEYERLNRLMSAVREELKESLLQDHSWAVRE